MSPAPANGGDPARSIQLRADPTGWVRVEAALRLDDFIEIGPRGVRPSSYERVWLPHGTIRTITIDRWIGAGRGIQPMTCTTAALTDGRLVRMPGLRRPEGLVHVNEGPTVGVQRRNRGEGRWAPVDDSSGSPLQWSAATDEVVVKLLSAFVERHGRLGTADPSVAGAVKLRGLLGYEASPPVSSLSELLSALVPKVPRYRRWERQP